MRMRPGKPCPRCCPAASWAVQQVGGSEEGWQAARRRGGVGVGVWAVLPWDVLQANTTPERMPSWLVVLISSPLFLRTAHLALSRRGPPAPQAGASSSTWRCSICTCLKRCCRSGGMRQVRSLWGVVGMVPDQHH